jgi:hypothetical protein
MAKFSTELLPLPEPNAHADARVFERPQKHGAGFECPQKRRLLPPTDALPPLSTCPGLRFTLFFRRSCR